MKNKGFTLIELLAVITILGLVITLTIPVINNIIEDTAMKAFNVNAESMIQAAEQYFTENIIELPADVGNNTIVNLNTMIEQGYIKAIKNPRDENEECLGYVKVTKTDLKTFSYEPYLNCGGDYLTSGYYDNSEISDEGLIAHYNFDDFQEPTENLIASNRQKFVSWTVYQGASITLTQDVSVPEWGATDATRIQTSGGTNILKYYLSVVAPSVSGQSYTESIWIKNIGTKSVRLHTNLAVGPTIAPGEQTRAVFSTVGNGSSHLQMRFQALVIEDSLDFIVWRPQVEAKTYATPFVNGIRTGIVEDVSGNNHDAPLALNTTPKWIDNSSISGGAYEFYGNNKIDLNFPFTENNNYSMSLWVYRFDSFPSGDYNRFIGTQSWDVGRHGIMVTSSGLLAANTYFGSGYDYWLTSTITLPFNKWFNVVVTYDRQGYQKLYYNGELVGSVNMSPAALINWASDNICIACGTSVGVYKPHHGRIDEVRVYNRVLSADEIKFNYDIESH